MRGWGVIAAGVVVLWSAVAGAQEIRGSARVVDGDTLAIGDARVRLFGIDAPERGQPCRDGGDCGARAGSHLQSLIGDREVTCREEDVDRYGRIVATCFVGDTDLNRAMVRDGHALPYLEFSRRYADEVPGEAAFAPPWAYRRDGRAGATRNVAERPPRAPDETPDGDCAIKGNVSSSGQRIYHRPGEPSYVATRIDEARGERWFCTAAEAEAAGWRPVRR